MASKLSRKSAHRRSLVRNLLSSLILYESIKTTREKAMIVKSEIDILINKSKLQNLQSRRFAKSTLFDKNSYKKLFEQIVPRYGGVTSGYCKMYRLSNRLGDNAPMALLELSRKQEYLESKNKNENIKPSKTISDKKTKSK
ncbi:50S ribosomal protein L17 [Candidatus Berkelbacteria bacterium RIFOXYA2_FULL_43_10]|uniref:50S ribosomal protein L17 n=1 Tax=Candidatus Berkelbacteria bacterium RIFOXYA2_FULL_43_10 TaxID=1797472 RepID=A0A1F5EAC6_9BACT|nr:MAG: 50S ribosomal protein L17 [Candidatus Berkelbacteria bacterium RIFOXYA2_FULL_43_10]